MISKLRQSRYGTKWFERFWFLAHLFNAQHTEQEIHQAHHSALSLA